MPSFIRRYTCVPFTEEAIQALQEAQHRDELNALIAGGLDAAVGDLMNVHGPAALLGYEDCHWADQHYVFAEVDGQEWPAGHELDRALVAFEDRVAAFPGVVAAARQLQRLWRRARYDTAYRLARRCINHILAADGIIFVGESRRTMREDYDEVLGQLRGTRTFNRIYGDQQAARPEAGRGPQRSASPRRRR